MSNQKESQSEVFNIKEFILLALSNKYFYIASFIICLIVAFMINKFSPTIYEVNSIIGPVEDKRSSLLGGSDNNLFSGLGALGQSRNLENDINSLNSFSLVDATIKSLNLEVGYFTEKDKILKQSHQIYEGVPYAVSIDKSHLQPINARFYINILSETSFRLSSSENEVSLYNYVDNIIVSEHNVLKIDTICRFNETISNKNFKFSVSLNKELFPVNPKDGSISYFEFYHLDLLTNEYLKSLKVEPVNIRSSLINVFFQGENLDLTIEFLNKYMQTYLDENLGKKNKIAVNTINFIDSQISEISDSLVQSESKLRDYRASNQVTDLSYQGQQALEQMTKIEADRSTLQIQERYYNYILDYFNKNQDIAGLAPPSSANVVDPIMNRLVLDLLSLNAEKSAILSNNAEKNLFLGQLENKIRLQKQSIIENVKNNLNTLNLTQNELNYRADKLSKEISRLPRTELNMVSMQRKFNLSDAIYTFLLQKRSEAAITKASNYPDYEILEPARKITSTILSPRTMLNWLIAIFLGLMIPTIFIILKNFFNEKITSIHDIEHLLNRSVLSVIYTNYQKTESVVKESPGSSIAESFRNLRSSLFIRFRNKPLKVILVTSAQPQDGKSFICANLATSIASVGNKTVVVDCDLRRPTLHEKFKIDNSIGLSQYMMNHMTIDEIIQKSDIENLHVVTAGPVLPNSSELIEAGALDELIEHLKNKYEYVIIDTTPAGLVADAALMMKYASLILLVCRNNFTRKDVFSEALNLFNITKIENFDVVLNDINFKKSRYGRYDRYYKKYENPVIPFRKFKK
jgi:capsular exopolysaccharide synthesis family protein